MRRQILLFGTIFIVSICFFFVGFKFGVFLFSQNNDSNGLNANLVEPATNAIPEVATSTPGEIRKDFCAAETEFLEEGDEEFCFQNPKLTEPRGIEVDLTNNKALIYDEGKLIRILPLFYQSPENRWFEVPTGHFRVGVKHEKHLSSLFPVIMPYSVQFYEDFFIHGIPYYQNGEEVSSDFTGGCLRFANDFAKEIYDFARTGDQVVIYKTFDDLEIKEGFHPPVDLENSWIRQRFLNPFRQFRFFGGTDALELDYYQHTGLDFAPNTSSTEELSVYSIADGEIAKIQRNDGSDHGLGNTVVVRHASSSVEYYSLYAHLSRIGISIRKGDIIKKGDKIGEMGNSGFGCDDYWRIGEDGCESQAPADTHLHFEIKTAPVLENPEGGVACETALWEKRLCYGYTPDYPQNYGYFNPTEFLFTKLSEATNTSESTKIKED